MQMRSSKEDYLESENKRLKRLVGIGLPQRDIDILEEIKYGRPNTRDGKC